MVLSGGRKSFRIGLAVLIQYRSVMDTHPASHVAVAITLNAQASSLKISIFAHAGKTMRWIEKWSRPFRIVTTFCISMQSLREIKLCTPAVGAKIGVFLYVMLGLPACGGHSSNKYCVTVYGSILIRFSVLFSEWIVLSDALHSSHFRC